jgi:regulatory protein
MKRSPLEVAIRYLGYRSRTRQEIERKLQEKKFEPDVIRRTLDKLEKIELINDEQFARSFARNRVEVRRQGRYRIGLELLRLGIDKGLIDTALSHVSNDDEMTAAESLLSSRLHQWQDLEPIARKRRAMSLLQRRGFSPGIVYQLLKAL